VDPEAWTDRDQAGFLQSKAARYLRSELELLKENQLVTLKVVNMPAGSRKMNDGTTQRLSAAEAREEGVFAMGRLATIETIIANFLEPKQS
jgi:hypothetical protein